MHVPKYVMLATTLIRKDFWETLEQLQLSGPGCITVSQELK